SATRWNSLTPWFIRHGSVQPFSVTTGQYGRPLEGESGGIVPGSVRTTGSGRAAIAAFATEAAATAPVTAVAPRKNSRREAIVGSLVPDLAVRGSTATLQVVVSVPARGRQAARQRPAPASRGPACRSARVRGRPGRSRARATRPRSR